ncbi:MAG: histone deacetylase [Chloroflexota bacterium]|nr:histone deacetylase [Chloroflexota bacterium]
MSVGLVYDPIFLEHDTGSHPENAGRLMYVMNQLEENGLTERITSIPPRPATVEEVASVHSPAYIAEVESVARRGGGWLDPDTHVSPRSYDAALYAAGGLINALDAVMSAQTESAFALVRPPGHHATRTQGKGFCLFNNVAVAARHAQDSHRVERVLIADFDVHHGNGTQDAFYDDPGVLYFSTHQYPFYPGTGRIEETGAGEGHGTTVNVPLPAWCGDEEYLRVFDEVLLAAARRFRPQLIMVSAGYDAHWGDQLALMRVSVSGFAEMTRVLKGLADELCEGRMVFTLEGGYLYEALAASIGATIDILCGDCEVADPLGPPPDTRRPPPIDAILNAVKEAHQLG